jgi:hypothetical protein
MADLNSKASALVHAGRSALRATPADRARIEAALRAQLGPAALPVDSGISRAVKATGWKVVTGVAVGVCVIGAAAVWTLRPARGPRDVQARSGSPIARSVTNSAPELPRIAAPVRVPVESAPAVTPSSKAPAGARDRLAREVALLSQATVELRAGHAATALKMLREHQQKFPNGALSEERRAARAQALCMLGRVDEGRSELARLTPQSPAAARAEQVCESGASTHDTRP